MPDRQRLIISAGYLLFGRDFENKTSDQVIADIQSYQDANTTPMFIAVDEEGGYCQQSQHKLTASSLSFLVSPGIVRRGRTGSGCARMPRISPFCSATLGINLNLAPGVRRFNRFCKLYLPTQLRTAGGRNCGICLHCGQCHEPAADGKRPETFPRLRQ